MKKVTRLALLIPGGIALVAGSIGALALLGVLSFDGERLAAAHGILMTLGFVGTVISLERAVALGRVWALASPALLGLGGLALLTPADPRVGGALLTAGAMMLLAVYAALWQRQESPELATQVLGAALAAAAALLWTAGAPVATVLPWLAGFVLLTIAGERAELARLENPSIGARGLLASGTVCAGVIAATVAGDLGTALLGVAVLVLCTVLVTGDVARRMVRASGLPRFAAAAMLAGYAWMAVAGAVWLAGGVPDGAAYDAVIHAVFLGFTMSMIMAHAPIILPAVLRVALPYRRIMYVPLVLLHASLVLRLLAGDAYGVEAALTWGGVLNVAAVLGFAATAVGSVVVAARDARRTRRAQLAPVVDERLVEVAS
ncbi:hypothetical protein Lsed01_00112 [Demequina sediminis]|uniref:Uncharacterized protein n=1 Tax=Demequina sediminis TaxID=1930058 RepID=A0ABP9WCZ3_9MICO|nr:hypothetical protein [Demequina sediminis]BDZ60784.1 hypothetical protein GCM10025873_05750 [Demequina sediminis]